jgi:hypothetical protein
VVWFFVAGGAAGVVLVEYTIHSEEHVCTTLRNGACWAVDSCLYIVYGLVMDPQGGGCCLGARVGSSSRFGGGCGSGDCHHCQT